MSAQKEISLTSIDKDLTGQQLINNHNVKQDPLKLPNENSNIASQASISEACSNKIHSDQDRVIEYIQDEDELNASPDPTVKSTKDKSTKHEFVNPTVISNACNEQTGLTSFTKFVKNGDCSELKDDPDDSVIEFDLTSIQFRRKLYTDQSNQEFNSSMTKTHGLNGNLLTDISRKQSPITNCSTPDSSNRIPSKKGIEKMNSNSNPSNEQLLLRMRNLEKLLFKCQQLLRHKNSQIEIFRKALEKVDSFSVVVANVKEDLKNLRLSHESWALSVAQMKKLMHQELEARENKLNHSIKMLDETHKHIAELKNQQESYRLRIAELESKLISQSFAHEKERYSLTKELKVSEVNAIKQMQRDHEVNLERIRLGLEQTLKSLKRDLLMRDSEIIKYSTEIEKYKSKYQELETRLENKSALSRADKSTNHDNCVQNQSELDLLSEELNQSKEKFENLEKENHSMRTEILQLTQDFKKLSQENETQSSKNLKQIADLKAENESLLACQGTNIKEATETNTQNTLSVTEYEYLKNIVFQFMLGREPTVLAKVISTVFKYEQDQVEQICKVQEAMESLLDGVKTIK